MREQPYPKERRRAPPAYSRKRRRDSAMTRAVEPVIVIPMVDEPDSLILRLLRDMRAEMATKADLGAIRAEMATEFANVRAEMVTKAELQSQMRSLRADVASDLLIMRKELSEQIVGLRRAVVDYHSAVVGHGMLISDLEARLRRWSST